MAEKVCGEDALEMKQQYLKKAMISHGQHIEESIKWIFLINNLSTYLEEDVQIMSVKQMCKEVLNKNIPHIVRFEFIMKDGKKLTSHDKVIKLI